MLGCSQRGLHAALRQRYATDAGLLRRESGGGAVLVGPWLVGVSVVVAPDHPWVRGGVVDSYRDIAALHRAALADFGVPGEPLLPGDVARANAASPIVRWACFGSLSPWEIVAAGQRKLVGLAQRRRRNAVLLVAGTLVATPDWAMLCAATGNPDDEPLLAERTVSCEAVAGRPLDAGGFAAALDARLTEALGVAATPG